MDSVTHLLNHFTLSAGVFYTGNICGLHDFPQDEQRGHLHLIRSGNLQVIGVHTFDFSILEPTLLFLPRPDKHRLLADEQAGADVVCGTVQFGGGGINPISESLPDVVLIELRCLPGVDALLDMMFEEAFADRCGRQAVMDRLCEILIIRLLRYAIAQGQTQGGTLAGLADSRLRRVLEAIHDAPGQDWSLESMAAQAGMSRARFASRFREVIGETPAEYLASWRVMSAQRLLKKGHQLKRIATEVGYGSTSALARAFTRKLGCSPSEWLRKESRQPHDQNSSTVVPHAANVGVMNT
ncbi:cupin domain-containing protein [Acidovorax delafieldii]|uniref:AraC family transcriptional regulator n=1 Tax=Acidovorax delafieldii TaxID=47920 RepID=UPI003ED1447D